MYNFSYLPELEINYSALNVWLGQIFPTILSKMTKFEKSIKIPDGMMKYRNKSKVKFKVSTINYD